MVVRTIVHFEIPVDDFEKMSKFYGQVFGWKFKNASMPGMDYWLISTGPQGKSIGGGMYKKIGPDERPRNYIGVNSVDETAEALKKAGGKIMVEKQEVPGFGWSVIAADPEGNPIALFQPVMRSRKPRIKKSTRISTRT
ncbi:MAG: VOC family protein [Nitrososphaerota archaeon]|nr:VOC family protein [Nitrososphaerota archaeon]